jgi:hypothetical protein
VVSQNTMEWESVAEAINLWQTGSREWGGRGQGPSLTFEVTSPGSYFHIQSVTLFNIKWKLLGLLHIWREGKRTRELTSSQRHVSMSLGRKGNIVNSFVQLRKIKLRWKGSRSSRY